MLQRLRQPERQVHIHEVLEVERAVHLVGITERHHVHVARSRYALPFSISNSALLMRLARCGSMSPPKDTGSSEKRSTSPMRRCCASSTGLSCSKIAFTPLTKAAESAASP